MTTSVSYVPATPASVTSVDRLRLFLTPGRTGVPVVDVGPAVLQPNQSWAFEFPTPDDGFYYSIVTVSYDDGQVHEDKNDVVAVPAPPQLQAGEEWVAAWELDNPDSPHARDSALTASFILRTLSGRKYSGLRTTTETYVLADWTCGPAGAYQTQTEQQLGSFVGVRRLESGSPGRPDGRFRYDYLRLRQLPVRSIVEVSSGPDFEPLDPSTYSVRDRAELEVRTGARHETRVTYTYGALPPAAGRRAARVLANELLKAYSSDATCRLPDRVTSVSRQGISYTVMDAQDFLKDGRTGLYEVDLFLKAVNPDNARKKPRVFSPDLPRAGRVTTT